MIGVQIGLESYRQRTVPLFLSSSSVKRNKSLWKKGCIGGGGGGGGGSPQAFRAKKKIGEKIGFAKCSVSERTSSSLRLLKDNLKSTMKQDRPHNCPLMHYHKSITGTLDTVKIAKSFACANELCKRPKTLWEIRVRVCTRLVYDEPPKKRSTLKTLRRL